MTGAEMKQEATKRIINTEDEVVLKKILAFLEDVAAQKETVNLYKNYDAIKEQYG
ncbi:MAG TPA: hypothetical protein VGN63_09375 [Flavisolibacter sp.]|jgi:hypothetical protein|nr:hypothetical protein [Flavisolibacter sp.]